VETMLPGKAFLNLAIPKLGHIKPAV